MTLEAVRNRAGQMTRAERWTRWTACGPHQRDSLPNRDRRSQAAEVRPEMLDRLAPTEGWGTRRVCLMSCVCERWDKYSTGRTRDAGQI
jgi:hypothetical protein